MAKWKCSVCGYVYDEEKEGKPFSELDACPVCKQPASAFEPIGGTGEAQAGAEATAAQGTAAGASKEANPLAYPAE